jgi:hypothetical protein
MTRLEWRSSARAVEDAAFALAPAHWMLTRSWWELNERDLLKRTDYLIAWDSARPAALTPFVEVDEHSVFFYSPCTQLLIYLRDATAPALAGQASRQLGPRTLVGLVPNSDVSPLSATPLAYLPAVVAEAEAEARRRGIGAVAFHHLGDEDTAATKLLEELGYLTTPFDGTYGIAIDAAWRDLDDYIAGQRRRTEIRKERKRFVDRGYHVHWHAGLDDALVARIAPLNQALHERKGNHFTLDQVRDYFVRLPRESMPLIAMASHEQHDAAFLLAFVEPGGRLRAHEIGFFRGDDFLYFNILFYEPVVYAIAHGFAYLELGLQASDAKRVRANRFRRTHLALRTFEGELDRLWPEIRAALTARCDQLALTGER